MCGTLNSILTHFMSVLLCFWDRRKQHESYKNVYAFTNSFHISVCVSVFRYHALWSSMSN
jgi:hypothetical protein